VVVAVGVVALIGAAILGGATTQLHRARPAASPATAALTPTDRGRLAPLRGVPLRGATGLRLLVANDPAPFLLDVDRGTVQPVRGLPSARGRVVRVLPVGEDAVVVSERTCKDCRGAEVYRVRHRSTVATRIASARDVVATADGRAVWMLGDQGAGHCTLREIWLDGRPRRAPRPVPCTTQLVAETTAGLLVTTGSSPDGADWHGALVGPAGRLTRLPFPTPLAVAGHGHLVLGGAEPDGPLTITDLRGGAARRLSWPSVLAGGDEARVDPDGRPVAVGFADPAPPGGGQALDEWLLDTATGRWRHLPDLPANVYLKFTSTEWTADGRLVFLAQSAGHGDLVATWRPGEPRIAVRRVELPQRSGGSDSFVVW